MTEQSQAASSSTTAGTGGTPGASLPLDMSHLTTHYANYFHACGSPRELIIDFGLNSGLRTATGPEPVRVTQRMVLPWQTARELFSFLQAVLQQQEGRGPAAAPRPSLGGRESAGQGT